MWWPVEVYEQRYLESDDPRRQSGFGGDEARWEAARRPIVRAIDRGGTFLDVGCANGYLLESLVRWSPHALEPYGLDFSRRLVDVARARIPQWADRFYVGDALEWEPLRLFDFVRTELVYAPEESWREFAERLLTRAVAPGGRLILCGYGSPRWGVPAHPVRRIVREWGYEPVLELAEEAPEGGGAILELAVLEAQLAVPRPGRAGSARASV
jgi:SAM-dependent methyltransferase